MTKKILMQRKRPRALYIIGPGYMVTGHSLNTLSFLEQSYDIVIASGPEQNIRNRFNHHLLNSFRRAPSITKDFKLLYELLNVIRNSKPDVIIYSTPKVSFFALLVNLIYRIPSFMSTEEQSIKIIELKKLF